MSTALVKRQLTLDVWSMIEHVAPIMKESRLFGVASDSQAKSIMAKGYELGLPITASFEFIVVIDDKPTLIPRGALALIYASGELERLKIEDDGNQCTVYMKRRNGSEYTASFSMDDAKQAGLVKAKSAWEMYPANMRKWRAIGFCADVIFPDILGGLKRADELGADLTADGDIIEGSWTSTPASSNEPADSKNQEIVQEEQAPEPEKPQRDSATFLQELVQEYGGEAVLAANEGRIPGTIEECEAVEEKLAGGE